MRGDQKRQVVGRCSRDNGDGIGMNRNVNFDGMAVLVLCLCVLQSPFPNVLRPKSNYIFATAR